MWTIIYVIARKVRVRLLVRSEEIVKSIRKEMVMVGIHKISNKKGIYVKNVKDIQLVEQGRRNEQDQEHSAPQMFLTMRFLQKKESV